MMAVATAVTMCASSLFAFTACDGNTCSHDYEWTAKVAPTCTEKGLDTGVCKLCGDTSFRETEAVADNHVYGAWQIEEPTETATGKATKVCSANAEHAKLEVELPALGNAEAGYTVAEVKAPTDIEEGEKSYALANAAGEIKFTKKVSPTGVKTVARAVEAATARKSKIMNGTARYVSTYGSDSSQTDIIEYEYGNRYFHSVLTNSYERQERWFNADESGALIGLELRNGELSRLENYDEEENPYGIVKEESLEGYAFKLPNVDYATEYYGAEAMLEGLYEWGALNENGDFEQKMTAKYGVTSAEFSFSVYNTTMERLSLISVSFTLSSVYSLNEITVEAKTFPKQEDIMIYDDTTDSWVLDHVEIYVEKGTDNYYRLTEAAESADYYTDLYTIKQSAFGEVPSNPYNMNDLTVSSFKVYNCDYGYDLDLGDYKVTKKGEVDANNIPMEVNTPAYFMIDEVLPESATFMVDELRVYLREGEEDTLLASYSSTSASYSDIDKVLTLKSGKTGEVKFVLKTEKVEKVLTANVSPAKPTRIDAAVYSYQEPSDSYIVNNMQTVTVYQGQTLPFGVSVAIVGDYGTERDLDYIDSRATVTAKDASDNPVNLTDSTIEGKAVKVFTADTIGDYTVTLTSQADSTVTCTLTVHVVAPPAAATILNGTWKKGDVSATFTPASEGADNGTVVISKGADSETLTYAVDEGAVTLTHSSGTELGYGMRISDYYNVVLTHDDGDVILSPWSVYDMLLGTEWKYTQPYHTERFGEMTCDFYLTFDAVKHEVTIEEDSGTSGTFEYSLVEFEAGKYAFSFTQIGYDVCAIDTTVVQDNNCYLDTTGAENKIVLYIYSVFAGEYDDALDEYFGDYITGDFTIWEGFGGM